MSIFNRFFKPGEKSSAPSQESQNWDSLQEVKFNSPNQNTTTEESAETLTPNLRQQNKLIQVISNNDIDIINQSSADVTPAERENFLKLVANGTITDNHFNNVVAHINGPWISKHPNLIFDQKIQGDKHLSRILAYNTDLGFHNYADVTGSSLTNFIKRYPNPANFENASKDFLEMIKRNNPPAKYQEYIKSMQDFKHIVYGKKQEYFDQAKILQKEASSQYSSTPYSDAPIPEISNTLRPIESLLESATFDNDAFTQNGREYHLSTKHLEQADLAPHYELLLEDHRIGFSKPFKIQGRDACMGYVEAPDGKVRVRSYYRSNSAGVWRYMPDYATSEDGSIDWFGKGHGEESLTLPFEFQEKLNQIAQQNPANLNGIPADFLFAGAAHRYNSRKEYKEKLYSNDMVGDFYKEVSAKPSYDFGHAWDPLNPPESVDITGRISPDFNRELGSSSASTGRYGNTLYKLFPSYDNSLRYIMGEAQQDGELRPWLCGIEVANSKLTSTGCRSKYVSIGNIGTPLNEYKSQADGYGEEIGSIRYVSMWQNYLSKMPFIQRYLNQTRK